MLVVLTIVALLGIYNQAEAAIDECHMREIDLCLTPMMVSSEIPTNVEEMEKSCEIGDEVNSCFHNYTALCATPMIKEIIEMITAEPMEAQKKLCTPGSDEQARFLKNAPCFKEATSTDDMKSLTDDMIVALDKATKDKFNERVSTLCCGLQRMFKGTLQLVEGKCGAEVLNEASDMMGMSIGSLAETFCKGYDPEGPKCVGKLPPSGTKIDGTKSDSKFISLISTVLSSFS